MIFLVFGFVIFHNLIPTAEGFCSVKARDGKLVSEGECENPLNSAVLQDLDAKLQVRGMAEKSLRDCSYATLKLAKVLNDTGGVFDIYPTSYPNGVEIYCDLTTDGGGWTVFQRRMDGSVNFTRNWDDYVSGFGSSDKEYWMGLEKLHRLTSDGKYELRVDLEDWEGNRTYAKYSNFSVGNASDKYRLRVGGYSGNAGNSVNDQIVPKGDLDGQFFSTPDRDNDLHESTRCAEKFKSGWWFNACFLANLNGVYRDQRSDSGSYGQGIIWYHWKGDSYSLNFSEMKFRRKN